MTEEVMQVFWRQCVLNSEQNNSWKFVLKRQTLTGLYLDTKERAAIKILWNL